jgi:uncharacterized protein DUF3467
VGDRADDSCIDAEQEGKYTNYFKIGFNSFEFVLDLGQAYDDSVRALCHTRIVTSPAYAKALMQLLAESLTAYERVHGVIPKLSPRERLES